MRADVTGECSFPLDKGNPTLALAHHDYAFVELVVRAAACDRVGSRLLSEKGR